nr:MAG TPA: hypothetical protein [Caudoviricetes sp.]
MDEVKRVAFEMRPIWGTTPGTKGHKFYHLFKFPSDCEFAQKKERPSVLEHRAAKRKKLIRPYFRGLEGDCQV